MLKMISAALVFLNLLLLSLHAKEDLQRTADKMYHDALTEYSCVLTEREAEDAAVRLCRLEGLSVKSFEKTAVAMEILIKGLRAVVELQRQPDEVYETLQMQKYNISPANWSYYLKKYQTSEAIARLEKWIPNNERIIIRSLAKSYKKIIERWLLEQKILIISSRSSWDPNISDEQKLSSWWKRKVDRQARISDADKAVLIGILSRQAPMPKNQAEFWKQHFKHKLNSPADKKIKQKSGFFASRGSVFRGLCRTCRTSRTARKNGHVPRSPVFLLGFFSSLRVARTLSDKSDGAGKREKLIRTRNLRFPFFALPFRSGFRAFVRQVSSVRQVRRSRIASHDGFPSFCCTIEDREPSAQRKFFPLRFTLVIITQFPNLFLKLCRIRRKTFQ